MVIAGLIKDTISRQVNKVPFLGNIPILGWLFKNVTEEEERKELVIFLTPHIISGEEDILYVEELEKERKPYQERGYTKEGKPRKPRKQ